MSASNTCRSALLFYTLLMPCHSLPAQEVWLLKSPAPEVQIQELEVRKIIQDRKGFIWVASLNGLIRYDGYQCQFYRYEKTGKTSGLTHNYLTGLLEDANGKYIWMTTFGGGAHRFDRQKDWIEQVPLKMKNFKDAIALNALTIAEDKTLWVGGLHVAFKINSRTLKSEPITMLPERRQQPEILSVMPVTSDRIWFGTAQGLVEYDTLRKSGKIIAGSEGKSVRCILRDSRQRIIAGTGNGLLVSHPGGPGFFQQFSFEGQPFRYVKAIVETAPDEFWLGTDNGLWRWVFGAGVVRPVVLFNPAKGQKSDFEINDIFKDASGNWWIGTRYNGFWQIVPEYFHPFPDRFADKSPLRHSTVTAIYQSEDGILWVGTLSGLQLFDLKTGREIVPRADFQIPLFKIRVTFIVKDSQGNIWLGTFGGGYYKIASVKDFIQRGKLEHFELLDASGKPIVPNTVMRMLEDAHGNLWIGTWADGIHVRRPKYNDIVVLKNNPQDSNSISGNAVSSIVADHTGNIWVGTYSAGLNRTIAPPSEMPVNRFEHFFNDTTNVNSLSHDIVLSVYPDWQGSVWVGTYSGGLNRFDYKNKQWRNFTFNDGLADNLVYNILPDHAGNLWISTESGLSHFIVKENRIVNYTARNGLPFNRHYFFAAYRHAPTGRLYFGGTGGLYFFNPPDLREDAPLPEIQIASFRLFNKPVPVTSSSFLDEEISYENELILEHDQSVFTFLLSAVNYNNPEQNQYRYILEGFDKDTNFIGRQREITHTNLDPGTYKFRFSATDYRGIWGPEKVLSITIKPPLWATWWAYLIYLLTLAGILYGIYRFNLRRELALAEALRLKELDTVKSRLYANITHEFRTPLTVILGMTKQVLENPKEHFRNGLEMIARNGRQVLLLVNQMLDLSKLEGGKMVLHLVQDDIIPYLKYLLDSIHSLADNKDVHLHFLTDVESFKMDYDPERLKQVVFNLLSNAIKFTEAGGHVYLSVSVLPSEKHAQQQLQFKVRDTGEGIAGAHLPYIFDRFYQVDDSSTRRGEGTGIGLALTKELVKLMDGSIEAQSQLGKGSVFTVLLPVTRTAPPPQKNAPVSDVADPIDRAVFSPPAPEWDGADSAQPLVLIADDNADVVRYLITCLESVYRTAVAKDGNEALEKAIELMPDMVILDVMMPYKDGFEVCHILKNDARTSHIPIIMLTAKADAESRLQGIERGADAYLPKPFQPEELYAHIRKLLELRQKLQQYYRSQSDLAPEAETHVPTFEDAFVQHARSVVLRNLADEQFSVEQFCKELHMSHSHLHRKLIALTGLSATRFIRHIRLDAAKEMFKDPHLTIAAIASDAGFSDPSYFGRIFKKEFGITPAEWREKVLKS